MRTMERDIVGGFIFSQDEKILLGMSREGGVYEGIYCVPGGGIEPGETRLQALVREMLEETGIDIALGRIEEINESKDEREKTLKDNLERVLVKMTYYDFRIDLPDYAQDIQVRAEDDWIRPKWFDADELLRHPVSPPTKATLQKIGFLLR